MIEIVVHDTPLKVELPDSGGTAQIDNRRVACDCVRLPDGRYSMILDGRVYEFSVELDGDICHISNGADRYSATIIDPRRLGAQSQVHEAHGATVILRADMPGKVVRILVTPGEEVEREQGLLVLEAMKMQNEIRAPRRGFVRELGVVEGKTVASGDFLLSLE